MRNFVFERAERMEVEQLFREAGLPWPVVIPEEEVAAAAAARDAGQSWRPRVEKLPRE